MIIDMILWIVLFFIIAFATEIHLRKMQKHRQVKEEKKDRYQKRLDLDYYNSKKRMEKRRREIERNKELMRMYILTGLKPREN